MNLVRLIGALPKPLREFGLELTRPKLGIKSNLYAKLIRKDGSVKDYGLIGTRVVTAEFCKLVVDTMQAGADTDPNYLHSFGSHCSGTDTTAANASDTFADNITSNANIIDNNGTVETTGTITVGDTTNVFKSVATITYDDTYAVTEHMIVRWAEAGKLLDRNVFTAINVTNGDSILFTYTLTIADA
jgi:hypothetical protein